MYFTKFLMHIYYLSYLAIFFSYFSVNLRLQEMFARYTIFQINVKFNVSSKRWPLCFFSNIMRNNKFYRGLIFCSFEHGLLQRYVG